MYIPKHFGEKDTDVMLGFMKEFNFAAVVNSTKKRYWATHLPFIVSKRDEKIVLRAHMAKANPQWTGFRSDDEVLVIFQEPHAYISPSLYENKVSVPTWNYIAVHAYGVPKILPSREERIALLEESFEVFESSFRLQWDTLPAEYRDELLEGIVAFEIEVTNLEGKFKLSQNRTEGDRERIVQKLAKSNEKVKSDIARFMK
ncbi:MAG: FMN-binding negative transcriptional regulator [Ignavibacteria bacterium]|nr:FMN-binding negative transcriptional regulator [Ignavibacteria bacterium]